MKLIMHEIDGDFANDDWAFFRRIYGRQIGDKSAIDTIAEVAAETKRSLDVPINYPTSKFPPRDGMSLFITPEHDEETLIFAFQFPESYGSKEVKIRFLDDPFAFGDIGWNVAKFITETGVSEDRRLAYFVFDVAACKATREYRNAINQGVPYVRFPIIYRVVDDHYDFPPGMIPNHHSHEDLARFGNPHGHEHQPVAILRHWGPHFMDSYSVYLNAH